MFNYKLLSEYMLDVFLTTKRVLKMLLNFFLSLEATENIKKRR